MNADELLRAAHEDLAHGWNVRAGTRLRQAVASGNAEALDALVRALLLHRIPGGGAQEVRTRLEESGASLMAETQLLRATLRYVGAGETPDPQGAIGDLAAAAQAGLGAAAIELALLWHEQGGDGETAARGWLEQAAGADPLARELLDLLPMAGDPPLARPTPIPGDWPPPRAPRVRERLRESPRIERFREALDPLECAWLRGVARARLSPSLVVDPETGRPRADSVRTSETMSFDPSVSGIAVRRIAARMASLAGRDPACGEPLSVLRYTPGQEYKPHYDWFGPSGLARDGLRAAGERAMTALAYLNVPQEGGATLFTKLNLRVEPALGDVLVFANLNAAGQPEQLSQHAGEPVVAGEKWLASLWIRARPVDLA